MSSAAERAAWVIRPLDERDSEAFVPLRLDALAAHPGSFGQSVAEAQAAGPDGFRRSVRAQRAGDATFGAFDADRLVGVAGVLASRYEKARHRASLWGVYVVPERRGEGLGRALLQRCIEHARDHVEVLELIVGRESEAAAALYRSVEFESYGFCRDAIRVNGRSYDTELMSLRLRRP